jgi:hypothetical protein
MTKAELEDLLSRAGKLAQEWDFFLIGSQALRAVCPTIPRDIPTTIEADFYPRHHPKAWSLLRAELGNKSKFFKRHGYYLDCTDPGLATLPDGWTRRLIPFRTPRTGGVTAWCLEPHDLFASKLVAWREKDQHFLRAILEYKLAKTRVARNRIDDLPISPARRVELKRLVEELVAEQRASGTKSRRKK